MCHSAERRHLADTRASECKITSHHIAAAAVDAAARPGGELQPFGPPGPGQLLMVPHVTDAHWCQQGVVLQHCGTPRVSPDPLL